MELEHTDMKRNYHYEVIAWQGENASNEAYHANCTTKAEALRIARKLRAAAAYPSVELNKVFTAADDESNYLGFVAVVF